MRQGQIHYYTAGLANKDMILQDTGYYKLTATIEAFAPNEYRFRLTKTTDGTSSYQESFMTREEFMGLMEHIQNVTR